MSVHIADMELSEATLTEQLHSPSPLHHLSPAVRAPWQTPMVNFVGYILVPAGRRDFRLRRWINTVATPPVIHPTFAAAAVHIRAGFVIRTVGVCVESDATYQVNGFDFVDYASAYSHAATNGKLTDIVVMVPRPGHASIIFPLKYRITLLRVLEG
ncbi:hypothetical protein IV500_05145 [Paeniglutamicibacter antarcticus]|uniref:Uncharacterized protein n=1 Tax=Arthrobacter terrae TaxID=2935737 RepID=A0A931G4U9_9MICC|nr:hypothetical protein [Arthrobacter terrae]MBG0738805.1 hypothetical protein [Arthrobacter terrae]